MRWILSAIICLVFACNSNALEVTFGIGPTPIKYSPELKENAEKGDDEAQFQLGWCYYDGRGIEKNYEKAFEWFQKSADQNNSKGQYNLAVCYEEGKEIGRAHV